MSTREEAWEIPTQKPRLRQTALARARAVGREESAQPSAFQYLSPPSPSLLLILPPSLGSWPFPGVLASPSKYSLLPTWASRTLSKVFISKGLSWHKPLCPTVLGMASKIGHEVTGPFSAHTAIQAPPFGPVLLAHRAQQPSPFSRSFSYLPLLGGLPLLSGCVEPLPPPSVGQSWTTVAAGFGAWEGWIGFTQLHYTSRIKRTFLGLESSSASHFRQGPHYYPSTGIQECTLRNGPSTTSPKPPRPTLILSLLALEGHLIPPLWHLAPASGR